MLAVSLSGCGNSDILDPKNPVTLTLWHTYGQQLNERMRELVDEFNETVGAERGIFIQTTYIADAREVNERLLMVVNRDPGAPPLPDIALIYPRIGVSLVGADLLMDFSTQFTDEELSAYVPSFIEEGRLGSDAIYIMPIAKSTEVLYLNSTIFNRFANETGVDLSWLETFEGIGRVAEMYYDWSGGINFFYPEYLFNSALTGFEQLGGEFISDGRLNLDSPLFQRIWGAYYPLAVKGGVAIFDNYGNFLMASGDLVLVAGSSASVTFYPESVTYADNTREECELVILPYPVFEGGRNVAIQRGAGMSVFKSDATREYAAGVFIKWLTAPEQNMRFTRQTGYMPVTEAAFRDFMADDPENVPTDIIRRHYETLIFMQENYTFFVPPVFDGFEEMQRNYSQRLLQTAESSRREYLGLLETLEPAAAFEEARRGVFESFIAG